MSRIFYFFRGNISLAPPFPVVAPLLDKGRSWQPTWPKERMKCGVQVEAGCAQDKGGRRGAIAPPPQKKRKKERKETK